MPAMNYSRRKSGLYKILAVVYIVVFPVPTNSFRCSPTAATSSGRRNNNKDLSPRCLPSDDNIGISTFRKETSSAATVLFLSPNTQNDDEGGEKRQNTLQQRQDDGGLLDEKTYPV